MASQNVELAKVKNRIKLFLNRTVSNGFTESEAMDSMKKVGEYLSAYNLEITDIDLNSEEYMHHIVNVEGTTQITPIGKLVVGIARLCDCMVWMSRKPNTSYHFFGMETDVAMAVYLTEMLDGMLDSALNDFKQSAAYINFPNHRRRASVSFMYGITSRLNVRLNKMSDEKSEESQRYADKLHDVVGSTSNGVSIIDKKIKLVEAEHRKEFKWKLRPAARSTHKINYDMAAHGTIAGDKINLNRPIEGNTSSTLLLE